MNVIRDDMGLFERTGAIFVLLAIRENPGITKKGVITMDGENARTKFQRISEMIDAGLITYENGVRYNSKQLVLTEKGASIADHLYAIREIANGE